VRLGETGETGGEVRERDAEAGDEAAGEGGGGADRDLLAEHGARGDLEVVEGAGDAQAGAGAQMRGEQRVAAEVAGDRVGASVEVEGAAQAGDQRHEHRRERGRDEGL
jgi:hypothetical protein